MPKAPRTQPFDLVLGLRLLQPGGTFSAIAEELNVAPSQVHGSLSRLHAAGLLRPDTRTTNPRALGEFLLFGARYAFPASRGEIALGVPTAYSAPPLSALIDAVDVLVWPARCAEPVRGFALVPLYSGAITLRETSPETYRLVTLVDALRIGDPRIRSVAREALEGALGWRSASSG